MTLSQQSLYSSASLAGALKFDRRRAISAVIGTISGAPVLAALTPLARLASGYWVPWTAGTSEVSTITANATPATDGTFTLSVNGQATAAIDHDATAAVIQAALEALPNVTEGDVTAVATTGVDLGDASAVVTLNWGGQFAGQEVTVTIATGGLTGNVHVLAEGTAGVDADGANVIRGFLDPVSSKEQEGSAGLATSATTETTAIVITEGLFHYDSIALPTGEVQGDLDVALKAIPNHSPLLRLQGLAGAY